MNHSTETFDSPEDRRQRERVRWLENYVTKLEAMLEGALNELRLVKVNRQHTAD